MCLYSIVFFLLFEAAIYANEDVYKTASPKYFVTNDYKSEYNKVSMVGGPKVAYRNKLLLFSVANLFRH